MPRFLLPFTLQHPARLYKPQLSLGVAAWSGSLCALVHLAPPAWLRAPAMDRRKTLAGLSPAQLNARASLAPSRGGGGKGVACGAGGRVPIEKALSRMSLAGPLARRSSAYTTKVAGVRSDPRPVSDKGFQAACVRTVIAYLAGHGFEYAITPKVGAGLCFASVPSRGHLPFNRCCASGAIPPCLLTARTCS
mgnify:CR=1 FL=1